MSYTFAIVTTIRLWNDHLELRVITKSHIDRKIVFGELLTQLSGRRKDRTKQSHAAPPVMEYTLVLLSLTEKFRSQLPSFIYCACYGQLETQSMKVIEILDLSSHHTPTTAESKIDTTKRHSCNQKQRYFHRELTSCCFSVDTTQFPDIIVHFYSYMSDMLALGEASQTSQDNNIYTRTKADTTRENAMI